MKHWVLVMGMLLMAVAGRAEVGMKVTTNYTAAWFHGLGNATDGKTSTYFQSSDKQNVGKYVMVEFEKDVDLEGFSTESGSSKECPKSNNELQVSRDGVSWVAVGVFQDAAKSEFTHLGAKRIRYVRIYCTVKDNNKMRIDEIGMQYSEAQTSVRGDVNRDGKQDVSDVTALVDILLGRDEQEPTLYDHEAADVNADAELNISDVTLLVDLLLDRVTENFNIENPAVAEYMTKSNSTYSNTSGNYGQSFFDATRDYRTDQPNTKTITFTTSTAQQAQVTVALDQNYGQVVDNTTVTLDNGEGSYVLRNMVPGQNYYYKVEADGQVLTAGSLHATGQVRMIAIDHGFNIRDLGGWTGWNGNRVRYEQIYRGGSLGGGVNMNGERSADHNGDITEADRQELRRLGIKAQLDLRAAFYSGKYLSGETSYHSYSAGTKVLGEDTDLNNTQTDCGAYLEDATLINDVAWIIHELKMGRPVYFNCRQGADRTGALAFLIEGLLGCYEEANETHGNQMALDYELTGFSRANLVDNNKVSTSYRSAKEAYGSGKVFTKIVKDEAPGGGKGTVQERCYYFLNQFAIQNPSYFGVNTHDSYDLATNTRTTQTTHNAVGIGKEDLDWFINYMLGITDIEGNVEEGKTKWEAPVWAIEGDMPLQTVAEINANVVL